MENFPSFPKLDRGKSTVMAESNEEKKNGGDAGHGLAKALYSPYYSIYVYFK